MKRCRPALLLALALLLAPSLSRSPLLAQQAPAAPPDSALATPEATVRELYRLVSFRAGERTDWAKVRSLFLPQAVIFLRTSRTASAVFSLDGFIADFVRFDSSAVFAQNGFTETIMRMRPTVFREIAHVLVLYEAQVTNVQRQPQRGVDSIHLIRRDGRWWVASIVNDIPTPDAPAPSELLQ